MQIAKGNEQRMYGFHGVLGDFVLRSILIVANAVLAGYRRIQVLFARIQKREIHHVTQVQTEFTLQIDDDQFKV